MLTDGLTCIGDKQILLTSVQSLGRRMFFNPLANVLLVHHGFDLPVLTRFGMIEGHDEATDSPHILPFSIEKDPPPIRQRNLHVSGRQKDSCTNDSGHLIEGIDGGLHSALLCIMNKRDVVE